MECIITLADGQKIKMVEKDTNIREIDELILKLSFIDRYFSDKGWKPESEMRENIADIVAFISK